tara:strand:- start:1246 stop:1602 length:357 start_codon:yes stop_codon:yes gene_type:complete
MSLFSKLFNSKPKINDLSSPDFQPISGGDGTSLETVAIINCSSMGMANSLMDRFISERHGTQGEDWNRGIEHFVTTNQIPSGNIRCISITFNGGQREYYFNVSRPMNGSMKLFEMLNK